MSDEELRAKIARIMLEEPTITPAGRETAADRIMALVRERGPVIRWEMDAEYLARYGSKFDRAFIGNLCVGEIVNDAVAYIGDEQRDDVQPSREAVESSIRAALQGEKS